ncbi:hypothetical protein [Hymenobacter radiodurans]|uniref:hypothetical protein n=1 Tax=Hymenobacter radiodurans TaxID=2496028 RepID=UPI001058B490|nr:hypothetical protein [Hymenobacter radiodurans]
MAVAASVLILLGVWWQQQRTVEPTTTGIRETLGISEEVATPMPTSIAVSVDPLEQEGRSFIDAHCTSLPTVCQSGNLNPCAPN